MTDTQERATSTGRSDPDGVHQAWERFVEGADDISGVRPEVAISWHRCRDQYRVDPFLSEAPVAVAKVAHPLEHDAVFAELGFRAAAIVHEVANLGGIVIIADGSGTVLAEWGDKASLTAAADIGLARSFSWSESAVGTNGVGTALGAASPILIRREEHWCRIFHDWSSAGVPIRDAVSKEPIAALSIACPRGEVPSRARGWLATAATHTQNTLRRHARDGAVELLGAYQLARTRSTQPLAAVDTAGRVVIADDTAGVLLGVPSNTPAVDPAVRWAPRLQSFIHAAQFASTEASHKPDWMGSTQIFTHLSAEPSLIEIRPVFLYSNLVGHLISFGPASEGEHLPQAEVDGHFQHQPGRVVGVDKNRMLLLRLPEVSFAEAAGNEVWLSTDEGRLRAAASGLDKLENELAKAGFLRVHRQYVVNLNRIREIERRDKGELVLVMDDPKNTMVPVSRRNARAVRRALGI